MTVQEIFVRPCALLAPEDEPSAVEVLDRRRQNGKTYDLGNGLFRTQSRLGAIHYKNNYADDKEQWSEIDLEVSASGLVTAAPYTFEAFTDRVGFSFTSKRHGGLVTVELVQVGHAAVDNRRFTVRRDGNQWFWDDVELGLDMKIQLRPLSAEIFKLVKTGDAPKHFRWRITEDVDRRMFRRLTEGHDSSGRWLEINTLVTPGTTIGERETIFYDEEWTGRVGTIIDRATRQKDWIDDPAYPAIVDAVANENIISDADDGYEYAGAWNSNYASQWFGGYYFNDENGGLRFQTLGVPQGATVSAATITIQATTDNGQFQFKLYADDVDDAAVWSNGNLPSGITKTTANISSTITATGTFTLNVTSVVQEVISRGGWSSSNDIRFALINQATGGNASIAFYDYVQGQANAARLSVTYTAAGGDLSVSPSDTVSVAESITVDVADPQVSVSDAVGVAESIGRVLESFVNVSDTAAVAESVTVSVQATTTPTINVSDAVGVAESIGRVLIAHIGVNDAVAVAESVARTLVSHVNVSDAVGVAEAIGRLLTSFVGVSDAVGVAESVNVSIAAIGTLTISVSDSVTVGESDSADVSDPQVFVSDAVGVAESVNVSVITGYSISVSDAIAVAEAVTVALADLALSVSESVAVAESVGRLLVSFVAPSDSVNVAENVSALLLPQVAVSDAVAVAESTSAAVSTAQIAVSDTVAVSESVTVSVAGILPDRNVSVSESVSVSDVAVMALFLAAGPPGLRVAALDVGSIRASPTEIGSIRAGPSDTPVLRNTQQTQ